VTLLKSREIIHTTRVRDEYLATSIALEKGISFRFNNGQLLYPTTTTKRIRRFEEGQLLLALVHFQQATNTTYYFTKSTQLKNVLSKKIINSGDVSLHHWYVLALRDYYKVSKVGPTKAECDYFIKSTTHLNSLQEKHGALAGSFKEDPLLATGGDTYKQHDPTITSAYVEGVGALYEIMSYCPQSQEIVATRILSKKIINLAMRHITAQQVTLHDVLFKGFSFLSLGGIYRNDSSYSIQIDTPQHALSAYMVANKINSTDK
jgi:hypothetical protein